MARIGAQQQNSCTSIYGGVHSDTCGDDKNPLLYARKTVTNNQRQERRMMATLSNASESQMIRRQK